MLATLVVWTYSFSIFFVYGYGGITLLKRVFQLQEGIEIPFSIVAITGMVVLTTISSFLSLIMPLASTAACLVLLGGILITIFTRPWKKLSFPTYHPLVWMLFAAVFLVVLENATHKPTNYDTALYHAQAIHWIESYRAVPGLVNIQDRFAYNSSWLVLAASMSFAFLGLHSFHLINSVLLLTVMFYFGDGFQDLIQKQVKLSHVVKAILFFLPIFLYASDLSSPGTDLPPALLIWVTMVLILEKMEKRGLEFDIYSIVICILSILVITFKLSALPLSLLALLILIQQIRNKAWRRGAILMATMLFILLPWFLRNIILSGYLIYPVPQIDLFSFDWKYPLDATKSAALGLLWFNRFPFDAKDYIGMPMTQWIPLWFHQLDRGEKILLLIAIASPLGLFVDIFINPSLKSRYMYMIAFLINYIGIFFWLFTAPILRFGYAYLLASITLVSAPILIQILLWAKSNMVTVASSLVIFAFAFQLYILFTTMGLSNLSNRILLPADYPPSITQPCPIGDATIYCAQKLSQCNYEAFPCIPKPKNQVELRGLSLQDGFRTVGSQ